MREGEVLWSECYIEGIVRQGARKFKKSIGQDLQDLQD